MNKKITLALGVVILILVVGAVLVLSNLDLPQQSTNLTGINQTEVTTKVDNNVKTPEKNTPDNCIITVSGNKYDVTSLRNSHSGGDIFVCGTDMTSQFRKQHNLNLKMIEKYRI